MHLSKCESFSLFQTPGSGLKSSVCLCVCGFLSARHLGEVVPLLSRFLLLPSANLAVGCISGY